MNDIDIEKLRACLEQAKELYRALSIHLTEDDAIAFLELIGTIRELGGTDLEE